MVRTESAGGVVMNAKGEIALVQHGNTSFWGFPKGHIDPGETAREAASREIDEEIGVDQLEYVDDLGTYERYKSLIDGGDDTSELKIIHMFLFKTPQERLAPKDPEHPQALWFAPEDVEAKLTNPKDKDFFRSIAAKIASSR